MHFDVSDTLSNNKGTGFVPLRGIGLIYTGELFSFTISEK